MPFTPVPRRPVSEAVFEQLRSAILSGRYAAGDPLPAERVLAEAFAVNRHAVREALKRLQQAGLVEVRHGGATRVLDWRAGGGLDLLAHVPFAGDRGAGPELLRSVVEARRWIGIDVARLAAARATVAQVELLGERANDGADPDGDLTGLSERYEDLWRAIVGAADNVAYLLAYNSLLAAGAAAQEASQQVFEEEARDVSAHAELVAAIAAGDGERAATLADSLLSRSLAAALEALA
jgi:GntR family transcriptional regulator, transcriptional repressor for pyruvate dehydrogenase complex